MHLTPAQLAMLATDINNTPALASLPNNADSAHAIADYYNAAAAPAFIVWKMSVPRNDVGKTFVASALAAITAGNNDKLANFAAWNEVVNPSRQDQRQFFDDIFSAAAGASTRAALLVQWKRSATRGEKLFATGTGSDAVPGTMGVEGPVEPSDIIQARG